MDEPLIPYDLGTRPPPLDDPMHSDATTEVVILGDLALAIRDAVRSTRRYQFCDLHHPGPHFQWNDAQWSAFQDWAHDRSPTFHVNAWVLAISKIGEDSTSPTHPCRVHAALGAPAAAP